MQFGYFQEQSRDTSGPPVELSVVVVTYNEEDRIRSCLESILSSCSDFKTCEIILIDSNSSDRTVDIAAEYPITLAQIPDDRLTTPSAGRYVGTKFANAPAILFVDGDMILNEDWLEEAFALLEEPEIAGVDGQLNEPREDGNIVETDAVRGVALYDAEILQEVGGFDPYLQSMEDIHLGYTIRDAGYTLLRLPSVAGYHPTRPTVTEPLRRWKRGYMIGTGQVIRKSLDNPRLLIQYCSRLRYMLIVIIWLVIGLGSMLAIPLFLTWSLISLVGVGLVATKLGLRETFGFFFGKIIGTTGFIRGLLAPPKDPQLYPLSRVRIIKSGEIHQPD